MIDRLPGDRVPAATAALERLVAESNRAEFDWDSTLAALAEIRSRMRGPVDAVAVVREGREELEQRGMDKR